MTGANKAKLMDGTALARRLLELAKNKVEQIRTQVGMTPTLATVLVGDDRASATYVRMKRKRCEDAGMKSVRVELPSRDYHRAARCGNPQAGRRPTVHGILVQHPVPQPIDKRAGLRGYPGREGRGRRNLQHPRAGDPWDAGLWLLHPRGHHAPAPRIPRGTRRGPRGGPGAQPDPRSADGVPCSLNAHATVTLCHSRTRSLPSIVRGADILIAAVGKPRFVQGGWIKVGAVVIDAGYNEGNIGDVDFDGAIEPGFFDHAGARRRRPDDHRHLDKPDRRPAAAQQLGVQL